MRKNLLCGLIAGWMLVAGCNEPEKRMNAVEHGDDPDNSAKLAETYDNMTDNALLADMSISDMHFLPHRAVLTRLGIDRLTRLSALVQAFGGQIRFSTDEQDGKLVSDRQAAIVEFLQSAGMPHADTLVVRDMPGGNGMPATEAIQIKDNVGTYHPKPQQSTGTGTGTGTGMGPGAGQKP